ncbi:hypothetical protein LJC11_04910, partial [Bacteroidales bacterium OttesenSCG-928-I21]|nr:hypothetical protein [Bacteroidales bacterium OttesenSCG-928-I21]
TMVSVTLDSEGNQAKKLVPSMENVGFRLAIRSARNITNKSLMVYSMESNNKKIGIISVK